VPTSFSQQFGVERLGPAHVGHGRIERFGRLQRRIQQGAEGQDRDARFAFAARTSPLPKGKAFSTRCGVTPAPAPRG
jgi:hypothetical protein